MAIRSELKKMIKCHIEISAFFNLHFNNSTTCTMCNVHCTSKKKKNTHFNSSFVLLTPLDSKNE